MRTIRRGVFETLSFAALHFCVAFSVAFKFHERAWRRLDGAGPAGKNAAAACCGVLKAR